MLYATATAAITTIKLVLKKRMRNMSVLHIRRQINSYTTTTTITTTNEKDDESSIENRNNGDTVGNYGDQFSQEDYFDHSQVGTSETMKTIVKSAHRLGELTAKAQTLQTLKRYHQSIECYREILKLQPDNMLAHINLATIHHQNLERYKSALEHYSFVENVVKRGLQQVVDNGDHESISYEEKLLNRVYYQMVDCHKKMGNYTEALQCCQKILDNMADKTREQLDEADREFLDNVIRMKDSLINPL